MKDRRFVVIVIIVVCALTSLPYLYGYLSAPPDRVFMGIALGTPDTTQYFAWMRAFGQSHLIENRLTPEPNEAVFFNLLWWTLGRLALWSGLSLPLVFQAFRIVTAITFLALAYWFCGLFLAERGQRRVAFLLIAFGSGLGWLWVVHKYANGLADVAYPFDLYVVEPNTFLGMMAFPHFVQAALLILVVVALALFAFERRRLRDSAVMALWAGIVALILGLTHAYDLLLIYAIIGAYALVLWRREGFSSRLILIPAIIGVLSVAPALYSVYMTSAFPLWRDVLTQFSNAGAWTPNPLHLLILLGIPFFVALLAFGRNAGGEATKLQANREALLKTWFVVNFFVVYVPLNYQIHYLNGWQVPIAILATMALYRRVIPALKRFTDGSALALRSAVPRLLPALLLLAVLPTNAYLLTWRVVDLSRYNHPYYLTQDEWDALTWLNANAPSDAVVLSAMDVGQYVPSATGARAFLAHWAMTADLYGKQDMVRAFFDAEVGDAERAAILQSYNVRYILWGPTERAIGGYDLATSPYVQQVFERPQAAVYQVNGLLMNSGDGLDAESPSRLGK
jgi:hypothetical protein